MKNRIKRQTQVLLALMVLVLSHVNAQPEVGLNGSFFQPPGGEGYVMPLDQDPNFIWVFDDGTIINTNSGSGPNIFLTYYLYREDPPEHPPTVDVPGASSPGIGGIFEDPGLPGDAKSVILIDPLKGAGADIMPSGFDLPPFATEIRDGLQEALQELITRGCQIFRLSYDSETSPYYYESMFQQLDGTTITNIVELPGVTIHTFHFFVHCSDRTNYQITLYATSDRGEVIIDELSISEVSPNQGGQRKGGSGLPVAALPLGASAMTHQGATAFAYPGQPAPGNSGSTLPTIGWINPDRSISDFLQIEGHDVGFASEVELCGSHFSDRLWLAWTGQDGNAKLARITRPNSAQVFNLGATTGFTVMDCDYWGNAIVAWASPNGDSVNVRGYGRTGDQPSNTSFAIDGQSFTPLSISMNNNGEAAVMFSDSSGTSIQRVDVDNVVEIDMSFAGSWYSPFFNGEGFIWDIAEVNGVPTLALYYFTYQPDGSGRQAWVVGSAEIVNGIATVPVVISDGGIFGNAYNPDDVTLSNWGEIEVRVLGCRRALMTMRSALFGDHAYPVQKFTDSPLALPGICATGSAASKTNPPPMLAKGVAEVDGSFTGSWFSPERSFEGFIFDVTESNGQSTLVVYWFSYDVASTGRQLWLVGSAPLTGNTASVSLVSGSGPSFGPGYNPGDVTLLPFGNVSVTFNDCNSATIAFSVNGGESGNFNVQRLAALPSGAGGLCGS